MEEGWHECVCVLVCACGCDGIFDLLIKSIAIFILEDSFYY